MIVVADTSPVTALLTVGEAGLLVRLFKEVLIPEAVARELRRSHPSLPPWLRIVAARNAQQIRSLLESVDEGEAEAILLAEEVKADFLLIDERRGRRLAQQRGLPVLGLLGLVLIAKRRALIPSARQLLLRLHQEAGIFLDPDLRERALRTVGE